MCSGSEAGSYLRLIDSCITQIKARDSGFGILDSGFEIRDSGFGIWVSEFDLQLADHDVGALELVHPVLIPLHLPSQSALAFTSMFLCE